MRVLVLAAFLLLISAGDLARAGDDVAAWIISQGGRGTREPSGAVTAADLTGSWITDADLTRLATLPNLRRLDLSRTKITDAGLEHLKPLNEVIELRLRYAESVTDNGVAHIKGWKHLERLDLRGTKITSRVFESLAGLTTLRSLDIAFTRVSDEGFEELAALSRLEELAMGGNRILGPALSLLKLLPALRRLDAGGIQRVDSGLWGLALSDRNLEKLGALTQLEVLDLSGANIADRGLDRPGHALARRKELRSLADLRTLTRLHTLNLNRVPVNGEALQVLAELPALKHLMAGYNPLMDDEAAEVFARVRELETLFLTETNVSNTTLERLQAAKHLKKLYLGGTRVSAEAVENFRRSRPDCSVIWWKKRTADKEKPQSGAG